MKSYVLCLKHSLLLFTHDNYIFPPPSCNAKHPKWHNFNIRCSIFLYVLNDVQFFSLLNIFYNYFFVYIAVLRVPKYCIFLNIFCWQKCWCQRVEMGKDFCLRFQFCWWLATTGKETLLLSHHFTDVVLIIIF